MFSKTVLIAIFVVFCGHFGQQKTVKPVTKAPDFSGCDDTYQCFGLPNGCFNNEEPDCQLILKTQALGTGDVEFILIWEGSVNSSHRWVGAALSDDQSMGDDSATVFIINGKGAVQTEEGLTFVNKKTKKAGILPVQVAGITVQEQKYVDGRLDAKWTRKQKTTVGTLSFDMKANKYYIFLAYGPVKDGLLTHHTDQGMSAEAINLEIEPSTVSPRTTPRATTSYTKSTTADGRGGKASTITLSIILSIFAAILLVLN